MDFVNAKEVPDRRLTAAFGRVDRQAGRVRQGVERFLSSFRDRLVGPGQRGKLCVSRAGAHQDDQQPATQKDQTLDDRSRHICWLSGMWDTPVDCRQTRERVPSRHGDPVLP